MNHLLITLVCHCEAHHVSASGEMFTPGPGVHDKACPVHVTGTAFFFWCCPNCNAEMSRWGAADEEEETFAALATDPWCAACKNDQ